AQVLAKKGVNLLRYASNRGDPDLRKALAAYLCDFRAARCHPDQIVIVAGMQQAMLVSTMAVLNPGEVAWIEDPCYQQTRRVLTLAGVKIVPKPLDRHGIVIARLPKEPLPRIIYVTPSHQFPLGVTMTLQRRSSLLHFAHAHNAFVFEDDYDAEFRFVGPPLPSLQGIDNANRVIYAERRNFFIKQFNELLGDHFTLQVPEAGLNIVAWLKREEEFPMIRRITLGIGVRPSTLSFFCVEAKPKPAFVFGFAAWTPTQ